MGTPGGEKSPAAVAPAPPSIPAPAKAPANKNQRRLWVRGFELLRT
ncbi:hypothetical protein CVCC1112_2268 [Paenarthrobacter nicotinovorans]|nr:hypothetical protein CVCC1112_2268 [Paenarthrobacter nicotinovorans]